jgi:hypothetical protein
LILQNIQEEGDYSCVDQVGKHGTNTYHTHLQIYEA